MVATEGDPADPAIVLGSELNYPIWAPMNCQKDTLISSTEAANEYTRAAAARLNAAKALTFREITDPLPNRLTLLLGKDNSSLTEAL